MAPSNPSFLDEPVNLSNHEKYLMYLGYLNRVYDEMVKVLATDNGGKVKTIDGKIAASIMTMVDSKIIKLCFPDGRYTEDEIEKMHMEMLKMNIKDNVEHVIESIHEKLMGALNQGQNGEISIDDVKRMIKEMKG